MIHGAPSLCYKMYKTQEEMNKKKTKNKKNKEKKRIRHYFIYTTPYLRCEIGLSAITLIRKTHEPKMVLALTRPFSIEIHFETNIYVMYILRRLQRTIYIHSYRHKYIYVICSSQRNEVKVNLLLKRNACFYFTGINYVPVAPLYPMPPFVPHTINTFA